MVKKKTTVKKVVIEQLFQKGEEKLQITGLNVVGLSIVLFIF